MASRLLPAAAVLLALAAAAPAEEPPPGPGALEELDRAARSIVERCAPAVVRVEGERPVRLRVVAESPEARHRIEETLRLHGARETVMAAGFLVDAEGLVLTTSAAAGGGTTSIRVYFPDRGVREGRLVGEDVEAGVALVRVPPAEGVSPLLLSGRECGPGALTLLLAPSGSDAPFLRLGFVTEPRRALGCYDAWLLASTPVAPGHAGAPLLDARGTVVGLAVAAGENGDLPPSGAARNLAEFAAMRSRVDGSAPVSTFIPAAELARIVEELRERGSVRHGMVGVRLSPGEPVVSEVIPGGPADAAGVAAGDLVLAVDGVAVESGRAFGGFVRRRAPGTRVRLRLRAPGGAERETTVVLAELPERRRTPALFNGLGVVEREEAPDLRGARFSVAAVPGGRHVMVATVAPGSAAEAAGVEAGDWVVAIEEDPVLSEADYVRIATGPLGSRTEVRLMIYRPGEAERRTITLK